MNSVQIVKDLYDAFGRGDIPTVLAGLDAACEWREAEGNPYQPSGAPWIGPEAVLENLFVRRGGEWDGVTVTPREFHGAGDTVVVEGRYTGTFTATGKQLDAQVCHVWKLRGGKLASFQQYVDTAQLGAVMGV
jgi:ketosteroid isomerase-like protein